MKTNYTAMMFRALCVALPVMFLVTGCSRDMTDLDSYMQETRQKPSPPIEPIPTFPQFDAFLYGAAGKRSPFEKPQALTEITIDGTNVDGAVMVKPDELRPKEDLEQFNISS